MNVIACDVDSKIANLALMKISAYHKAQGDTVVLTKGPHVPIDAPFITPDRAYISCIFSWNRVKALRLVKGFESNGTAVMCGGTGISLSTVLPPVIETCLPDYELYGVDYAVGHCNRGCNRKCQFCAIPEKEGRIDNSKYAHPSKWVPAGFKKAVLLDNNIAMYPDKVQREIFEWFRQSGIKCSITQGYDIRLVSKERAAMLADLKPYSLNFTSVTLYIAWDSMDIEPVVKKNIPVLLEAGLRPYQIICYILCGFNTTFNQDLYRANLLWREFGVHPFVMVYNNRKDDIRIRRFAKWVNRRYFKVCAWEDFRGNPDNGT